MKNKDTAIQHEILAEFKDHKGVSIREHSFAAPFLLLLLRHIGCSFCRKTLNELSASMKHISDCGYRVGLVHMDDDDAMIAQLKRYGLEKLPRFHDPERKLYKAMGLTRAPMLSVFRAGMWKRGFQESRKHGFAMPKSDPLQLPGAVLIDQGLLVAGEQTLSPEEPPDFLALLIRSEAMA